MYVAFTTLVFVGISASMANAAVDTATNFFEFWFTFFALSLAITYLGLFLAIVFPKPQAGVLPLYFIKEVVYGTIAGTWVLCVNASLPSRRLGVSQSFTWYEWLYMLSCTAQNISGRCRDGHICSIPFLCPYS